MVRFQTPFFLFFLFAISLCQLTYVTSLFRHGARYTVLQLYDHTDSDLDDGELTGVGMRQHYNLGRYIRQQYIDSLKFLSKEFNHREMLVYSTQKNRTIQSALSHLYGLYPDTFGPQLPKGINQSFLLPPYSQAQHFIDSSYHYSLSYGNSAFPMHSADSFFNCPHQTHLILQTMKHKAAHVAALDLEYTPFFLRVASIFKLKPQYEANIGVMVLLYDNLIAEHYKGRQFPWEFSWHDLMNLRHLYQLMMSLTFEGDAGRAKSSILFTKIIADFDAKINNVTSERKWTLLSGHDTNVLPAMIFLNITNSTCLEEKWKGKNVEGYVNCEEGPDYAASLLFQLHREDIGVFIVKIKYNGRYVNVCGRKEKSCLYEEWKERVERQYVDYNKLCGIGKEETKLLREQVE